MERKITLEQCRAAGFTNAAYMDPMQMEFLPEVRNMCEADRCHSYDKCWACPPACGTLEELREKIRSYPYGILLQVTGQMEDDYDIDAIQETQKRCKAALERFLEEIRPQCSRVLAMDAGGCKRCETCTYPDAPCRFPETLAPSLEACGLFVSRECERAGIPYYYGPQTMTFSAAVMIED